MAERAAGSPDPRTWQPARNWPLWVGSLLVLLILFVAVRGPALAPHDPIAPLYILQHPVSGEFVKPPFQPLQVPGFPLGADPLGRDLWSQLLWAIRPTLTLVCMTAVLRLVLGLLLGVVSGWGVKPLGRMIEAVTAVAVAVPVLLVALCLIAAFGPRWGVWAFVLGLCVTGWAEVARIIHEQTRLVRAQPYVEAARALGISDLGAIARHVMPHLLPTVWLLLPFEISSALLATASLGFLGYYVNAIWVPLGDWTAIRTAGQPELGQILASSAGRVLQNPWELLIAGAAVFVVVLGFNLVGEGLRRQTGLQRVRRRKGRVARTLDRTANQIGAVVWERMATSRASLTTAAAIAALLLLLAGGGIVLGQMRSTIDTPTAIVTPGGQQWASAAHDAQGTYWSPAPGPVQPQLMWTFVDEAGFAGGPAITVDGDIVIAARQGALYRLDASGNVRLRLKLPEPLFGVPALSPEGNIYVLDAAGQLWAFSAAGETLWAVAADPGAAPIASPVSDEQGVVYFSTERSLIAVAATGDVRWRIALPTYSYTAPQPRLTFSGPYLLFEDFLIDRQTGRIHAPATEKLLDAYFVGADGQLYLGAQDTVDRVVVTAEGMETVPQARLDLLSTNLGFRVPTARGVAPDGRIWVFYGSQYEFIKLLWMESTGAVARMVDYPWSGAEAILIGLDASGAVYACGRSGRSVTTRSLECSAYSQDRADATWRIEFDYNDAPIGGALVANRLYVATRAGMLLAIGSAAPLE